MMASREVNRRMPLDPSISGHLPNAQLLAKACDLAYLNEPRGPEAYKSDLGLNARLISVDNTQAYLASDQEAIVVVFRGSESPTNLDGFKDWLLTNANNLLVIPDGRIGTDFASAGVGARFHRGFMEALAEIWDPLAEAVQQAWDELERPLWVTGHSLGGAIALLAAWRFQRHFIPIHEVVTFGAPMIGNAAAAHAFEQEFPDKIFRYVDIEDPVPLLPAVSLVANAYDHCLKEIRLRGASPKAFSHALGELGRTAAEGLMSASLIDEIWELLNRRIDAHLIPNYYEQLRDL
jgi:pimeloyl-ACP methyl ester carboxylesterase